MTGEIDWFASEAGQSLVAKSMQQAKPWVWPLCGHNALVLQPNRQTIVQPALQCAPVLSIARHNEFFVGDFIARDKNLPLASDCVALVYAAFVLETSATPALLLAEFERLLVSEGHLALLSLNPYCPFRMLGRWKNFDLKSQAFWAQYLQHAGLELVQHQALGPLWASVAKEPSSGFSYRPKPLRSVNFILAKKRKATVTPIRKSSHVVALARETLQQ